MSERFHSKVRSLRERRELRSLCKQSQQYLLDGSIGTCSQRRLHFWTHLFSQDCLYVQELNVNRYCETFTHWSNKKTVYKK